MKTLFASAALAAACLAAPVVAEDAPAASVAVRHADLDLGNPAHVRRLDRRIDRAIVWACGNPSYYDLSGANATARCKTAKRAQLLPARTAAIRAAQGVALADRR